MSVNLVGSYFAVQWLANILVTASTVAICSSSQTVNVAGDFIYLFAMFGLSVLGTNLLCHRYLCKKARTMIKLYVGRVISSHSAPSLP